LTASVMDAQSAIKIRGAFIASVTAPATRSKPPPLRVR
jgi:hypothetical protein